MPIYEYECKDCGRVSGFLVMKAGQEKGLRCKGCGGGHLKRIVSRFAHHRTEAQRLQDFDAKRPRDLSFYKDPRNVGLWAKKRAKELGADLGDSFEETLEKGRSGKLLDDL